MGVRSNESRKPLCDDWLVVRAAVEPDNSAFVRGGFTNAGSSGSLRTISWSVVSDWWRCAILRDLLRLDILGWKRLFGCSCRRRCCCCRRIRDCLGCCGMIGKARATFWQATSWLFRLLLSQSHRETRNDIDRIFQQRNDPLVAVILRHDSWRWWWCFFGGGSGHLSDIVGSSSSRMRRSNQCNSVQFYSYNQELWLHTFSSYFVVLVFASLSFFSWWRYSAGIKTKRRPLCIKSTG